MTNKKKKLIICISVAIAIIAAVTIFMRSNKRQPITIIYETAKVERATISNSVTATGTIEPVNKVEVGTQVSGIISKIYVDYNSIVKKVLRVFIIIGLMSLKYYRHPHGHFALAPVAPCVVGDEAYFHLVLAFAQLSVKCVLP